MPAAMRHKSIDLHRSTIELGYECIPDCLALCELGRYSSVFVISQEQVWSLHGHRVQIALDGLAPAARLRLIADGEPTKRLAVFGELLHWLADEGADRSSLIIVLGGGVVGDLSGFVAASYMRGIDWIYIPTTLLAQQDASVGGKTGLNLPQGKNLVGAFWEPRKVIIDGATLTTLPVREIHAGYMEFLKHAVLHGEELFRQVAAMPPGKLAFEEQMELLARGLEVKVDIVARDPLEKGDRRLLNLGHTLGHAIESYTEYHQFLHGEAVGLGMVYAACLAQQLGSDYNYEPLVEAVKARVTVKDINAWDGDRLIALTQLDKKGVKGIVAWIVPCAPGRVEIVKGIEVAALHGAYRAFVERMR